MKRKAEVRPGAVAIIPKFAVHLVEQLSGEPEDVAWFFLKNRAEEYADFLNGKVHEARISLATEMKMRSALLAARNTMIRMGWDCMPGGDKCRMAFKTVTEAMDEAGSVAPPGRK